HQSTVSVVVKRLVRAGLVSRSASPEDARSMQLALTKRGERLLERAPLAGQDRLIQGIERLSLAERRKLAGSLHAGGNAMQIADDPPQMFFETESQTSAEPDQAPTRARTRKREPSSKEKKP